VGRWDHFFNLGGTSLSAIKLAIAFDRALSFKEIASHPILAHQAELMDRRGVGAAAEPVPMQPLRGDQRSEMTTSGARLDEGGT